MAIMEQVPAPTPQTCGDCQDYEMRRAWGKCGRFGFSVRTMGRACNFIHPLTHQRPDIRERRRAYLRVYGQRPDVREGKRAYDQRPDVRERRRAYGQRPDVRERRRAYLRVYGQRPDVRERRRAYLRVYGQRPDVRERRRAYMRAYMRAYYEYRKARIDDAMGEAPT